MKFGLVGCGAVARRGHLPALTRIPEAEVTAVSDKKGSVAAKIAKRFNVPTFYNNMETLLTEEEVDTVVIATSTTTHADLVIRAAEKGKNIVVEKPLCMSLEECSKIKNAVERSNVFLTMVQNFRYVESAKAAKRMLDTYLLGKLTSFHGVSSTRYPTSWTRSRWPYHEKGVLYDFTPHVVDMLLWLNRFSPKIVFAVGGSSNKANFLDHLNFLLEMENGPSGLIETSWLSNAFAFALTLRGSSGLIRLDIRYDLLEEEFGLQTPLDDVLRIIKRVSKVLKDTFTSKLFGRGMNEYLPFYLDVIKGIENHEPPIPLNEGIQVVAVLEAAFMSFKRGQPIDVQGLLKKHGLL